MRIRWDIRLCDDFHVSNQGIRRIEIFSLILSWNQTVGIYDLRSVGNYGKIMIVELEWIEIEITEGSFDFKDLNTILWI